MGTQALKCRGVCGSGAKPGQLSAAARGRWGASSPRWWTRSVVRADEQKGPVIREVMQHQRNADTIRKMLMRTWFAS